MKSMTILESMTLASVMLIIASAVSIFLVVSPAEAQECDPRVASCPIPGCNPSIMSCPPLPPPPTCQIINEVADANDRGNPDAGVGEEIRDAAGRHGITCPEEDPDAGAETD